MTSLDTAVELQITKLLASVAEYKASDLHLTVGSSPSLRIAGKIVPLTSEPLLTPEFVEAVVFSLISEEQKQTLERQRSLLFLHTFKSKTRYKVHVYYQQGYLSSSFRLIPPVANPITALAVSDEVKQLATITDGLILITGAYGSGKTTLLAGFIEYYNQQLSKHIVTIEQPVEFLYNDNKCIVEQREVGTDITDISKVADFASTEDVDIVALSTPLNKELISTAFHLVRMGKLVLLEVTAQSIKHLLQDILALYPAEEQITIRENLSSNLQAVIGLRAVPNTAGSVSIASEIMRINPGMKQMLSQDNLDKLDMLMESGRAEGMLTMQQSLQALTQAGQINPHV